MSQPMRCRRKIERFLAGRPVLAREPTFGYLLLRFIGRHRLGVAGAAAALLLAAAAVGGIIWHARIARVERAEAQRRFELLRKLALQLEVASAYRRLADVQGDPDQFDLGDVPGAIRSLDQARRILEPLCTLREAEWEPVNVKVRGAIINRL